MYTRTYSNTHTHIFAHTHTHTHMHTHTPFPSLSLSLSHTHVHILSLTHQQTNTHTHTPWHARTRTHTNTNTRSGTCANPIVSHTQYTTAFECIDILGNFWRCLGIHVNHKCIYIYICMKAYTYIWYLVTLPRHTCMHTFVFVYMHK